MLIRAESKALLKTVASPLQSPQTEVADSRSDAEPAPNSVAAGVHGWGCTSRLDRSCLHGTGNLALASRQAEDQQVELLMQQLQDQDNLSEAERGLLLDRLVALERLQEAEVVVQPWLSGRSTPLELSLFKAELQRRNGQPEAARHSLQHLLPLHPNDLQVLQLLVLLDQEQGRQHQVTAELTARFKGLEPGQRLEIGLLLADLLRQGGSNQVAMKLYGQLA